MNLEALMRDYIDHCFCRPEYRVITMQKYFDGVITFNIRFRRKNFPIKPPKYLEIKLVYFGTSTVGFTTHEDHLESIKNIINESGKHKPGIRT